MLTFLLSRHLRISETETNEGQCWILACWKPRPRQSEKAPLSAREWHQITGKLNPLLNTHTALGCVQSHPQAHTHTTQAASPSHRLVHTKAHLSGPFHCVSKSKEVYLPPQPLCMWYSMSVILKQIHSVPYFSSEIMAWAIFTFRQAGTHAVSRSPSPSLSLCLMNGIRSEPPWFRSNLPLKICTNYQYKKRAQSSLCSCTCLQNTLAHKISAQILTTCLAVNMISVLYPCGKGPGLRQEPPNCAGLLMCDVHSREESLQ